MESRAEEKKETGQEGVIIGSGNKLKKRKTKTVLVKIKK